MIIFTTALLALVPTAPVGPPAPGAAVALLAPAAFDSLEELKAEIEAAKKDDQVKKTGLGDDQALDFGKRALALAKAAKDAAGRAEALTVACTLPVRKPSEEVEKLRGQIWDLVIAKDADEGAALAPLVSSYLRDAERAASLAKKTKSKELKAVCAYVPLVPWISSRERSEADTKKLVADLRALQKEFGTVVDPTRKKPWSEIVEDVLFPIERLAIGSEVPEIEGADLSGVNFKLSDYRGKVVMIDFWGHW